MGVMSKLQLRTVSMSFDLQLKLRPDEAARVVITFGPSEKSAGDIRQRQHEHIPLVLFLPSAPLTTLGCCMSRSLWCVTGYYVTPFM